MTQANAVLMTRENEGRTNIVMCNYEEPVGKTDPDSVIRRRKTKPDDWNQPIIMKKLLKKKNNEDY